MLEFANTKNALVVDHSKLKHKHDKTNQINKHVTQGSNKKQMACANEDKLRRVYLQSN